KEYFGFDSFKGNQEAIIENLLAGNDTFVLMPTGGGKSLCYQLPSLLMDGVAIVISPLIALMKNQVDAMRSFSEEDGVAHFINSSLSRAAIEEVKTDVLSGKTKLLYVAPESLTKEENIQFLQGVKISFYAVDEAHCISEWGHDFRPEYRKIRPIISQIGNAPVIALTATATPKVQHDIQKNLGMTNAQVFKSSFNRSNLYYEVRKKNQSIDKEIIKFIKSQEGKSGIIYCLSRKKVEDLAETLRVNGINALAYHAGMDSNVRSENQDNFLMEKVEVIVATIAFGMGIDKPDVRYVIHYDIPKSLEGYYQETGRAGRDGGEGQCIAYYSYKDIHKLEKFMQGKPIAEQEINKQLLSEVMSYAESSQCRRKLLLNYFGEEYEEDNCHCCDNCIHPKPTFDGRKEMKLVIDLILSLPERFKIDHLAGILAGKANAIIKSYKHDEIDFFGEGEDHSEKFWCTVIHQGITSHLLYKEIETYGLVHVTDLGKQFAAKPWELKLVEDRKFTEGTEVEESDDDEGGAAALHAGGGAGDPMLLAMLKDLRKDLSRRLKLQPWIIFGDPTLEDMATLYPITFDELKNCQGVGEGKAHKFGEEFIKLIKKYVDENEIIRPDDFVVKSAPNKSANKIFIIQSIDRRMDLEDIAEAKGLEMSELLSEIEAIVASGMKLKLDYYIENNLDDDIVEEIYDYFKTEATSDDVETAIQALGPDYYEEEVRLVRIKFLCEIAS
ncbi:MAG: DNA helicase RecQ, partial [Bacteroidales bacterium]|nr:DNA helicase RecQ [Bacteroidales bacterium]